MVNDQLNFFKPTKKPTGYATDKVGRRKRVYDTPTTPYRRLLASGVLSAAQQQELAAYKASLDPVAIASQIDRIQQRLTKLAAAPTRELEREIQSSQALPDPGGIKIHHKAS